MSCENSLNNFYRGDTVPIKITIKDNAGVPIDITGSRIRITLKEDIEDADPGALQKDAVLLDQVTNKGEALLTLSSSDTNIDAREYYYDIEWKDSADNIRTLINGTISIFADVTTN